MVLLGLPNQGLLSAPDHPRGGALRAYFPHHRQHIGRNGMAFPRTRPGRRQPLPAPERDTSAATDALASLLLTGQWQQQLAACGPELLQSTQASAQACSLMLASLWQQAQCMWQHVVANWPAWQSSLQEDAEIVLEYALGLIPIWLAMLHASILQAYNRAAASEPVQQALATTTAAAAAMEASAANATEAAQRHWEQGTEAAQRHWRQGVLLIRQQLLQRLPSEQPPAAHTEADDHDSSNKRSRKLDAARVAYSMAWFGFGGTPAGNQQLVPHAQQQQQEASHMSLQEWQQLQLAQQQEVLEPVGGRRWKRPQRREWVDRVVHRARNSGQQRHTLPSDHLWQPRYDGGWTAPLQHAATVFNAARQGVHQGVQQGVQGCVEAVQATGKAAVGGVQQTANVLVAPVQCAAGALRRVEPPPAGLLVAAAVLLAGAAANALKQKQQENALLAQQQEVVMQQRAEQLRAQKARVRGVLSVEEPSAASSSSSRRQASTASAPAAAAAATAAATEEEVDEDSSVDSISSGEGISVELDPEAAAMFKKFLAGSRATEVPLWNNRMADDMPKVSRVEVDEQTAKIRSAAAPEERAAIEQADMEQLSRQLQQLDHAPIGRAARAAWLKERQQQGQGQEQGAAEEQAETVARAAVPAAEGSADSDTDSSNPFAVSDEVRAKWDSDDEAPAAPSRAKPPAPRSAVSRSSSSSGGSRSVSRGGSRSRSPPGAEAAGSNNPFAISPQVREQWEAEDHLYSEPGGKPLLGKMLGGFVTALTSGRVKPQDARQHQQRRQQARRAEELEAAVMLRLQQREQEAAARQQRPGVPAAAGVASGGGSDGDTQLQQQPKEGATAAEVGSPEWNEQLRQDVLRSGAARRARLQQMRSQGGQAARATQQQQLRQQQQRMEGSRSSDPAVPSAAESPSIAAGPKPAARGSVSLSAAVSAADAQGVTPAIPVQEAVAAAGRTEGLGAAPASQVQQGSPALHGEEGAKAEAGASGPQA